MTAVASEQSKTTCARLSPRTRGLIWLEARGHTTWLAEQRPNHVHEVDAVFEQHTSFRFRLEPLGRFSCVVLTQVQEARPAEEAGTVPLQDVAKPGSIGMVLVNQKQAMVIPQRGHERARVLQTIAQRFLTNDVDAGLRRSQTVLAMQPRRRENVDEIEPRLRAGLDVVGEQLVERAVETRLRRELRAALLGPSAHWIDEGDDLDFGNPLPAAQVEFRNHSATDDRSPQSHSLVPRP